MFDWHFLSLLFSQIQWILGDAFDTVNGGGNVQSAKAGKASRAGSRAGRIVRLVRMVRLVRLVKLYKYGTNANDKLKNINNADQVRL